MDAYAIVLPEPLRTALTECETECVAECCGLDAFDFAGLERWPAERADAKRAVREQLLGLIAEVGGRPEKQVKCDGLNAWWSRTGAVCFLNELLRRVDAP